MQYHLPIYIIGIGSPHGDDQFGWQAARRLRDSASFQKAYGDQVRIVLCSTPLDGFFEFAKASRALIVLDALASGSRPGTVVRIDESMLPTVSSPSSSHGIGLAQVVELGRILDILPEKIIVLGVELGSVKACSPMGQALDHSLQHIEQRVAEEIECLGLMD